MTRRPPSLEPGYWRRKPLDQLSRAEWEALCDGCGKCCLIKLEDPDDGRLAYTRIACRLFDPETCRCGQYDHRATLVPTCVRLTPDSLRAVAEWMPRSCAYRLVLEGRDLPDWHPLRSGDPDSVHAAGKSVRGWTVPEYEVDEEDFEDHVLPGYL
ncbi:MAG: YcgN family cysteine cluster protein [Rubrimonas sp.]|uniref:YcgN family cysteine cluster protein n=1 Tax=Rubrimonas sp. TaxID=2036015 RepID=UPI002FDE40B4